MYIFKDLTMYITDVCFNAFSYPVAGTYVQ